MILNNSYIFILYNLILELDYLNIITIFQYTLLISSIGIIGEIVHLASNGVKKITKIVVVGGLGKLGADLYDAIKDTVKDNINTGNSGSSSNNSGSSSNNSGGSSK